MMKWIASGRGGAMKAIMVEQAALLREQMSTATISEAAPVVDKPRSPLDQLLSEIERFTG